jgi:hypothetical protein
LKKGVLFFNQNHMAQDGNVQEVGGVDESLERPASPLAQMGIRKIDGGPVYTSPQSQALAKELGLRTEVPVPDEEAVRGETDFLVAIDNLFARYGVTAFDAEELKERFVQEGRRWRSASEGRESMRKELNLRNLTRGLLGKVGFNVDLEPKGLPDLPKVPRLAIDEAIAQDNERSGPMNVVVGQMLRDGRLQQIFDGIDPAVGQRLRLLCPTAKLFAREEDPKASE